MDLLLEKWEEILYLVKAEHALSDISFKTWLQPLVIQDVSDRVVTIMVPSKQVGIEYIARKYTFPIKVAIAEVTGKEYDIEFVLPNQTGTLENKQKFSQNSGENGMNVEKANLNPKYTFDSFVVGNNNKFAHAAALAVAESPGEIYNPLFIHGDAGLGKTHLMHAIAHFIIKHQPEKKVLYVTSETFTNELVDSIRNSNNTAMNKFREKYRSVDILLIDDIQFIIGKEATQEEFFHTFNDLHEHKKQIIISSDKPPKDIETLEARLRSRFMWGLVADISTPDFETRMAILHKKAESEGLNVDVEVIKYIATNVKSNIRELEGSLTRVMALRDLTHRNITLDLAEDALKDIISPDTNKEITPATIIAAVAEHFHISVDDIKGSKRSSNIVYPRQIAMYLCNCMTEASQKMIGAEMGNRDHTTVIHGIKKIETEIKKSENVKNTVEVLKKKISSP